MSEPGDVGSGGASLRRHGLLVGRQRPLVFFAPSIAFLTGLATAPD